MCDESCSNPRGRWTTPPREQPNEIAAFHHDIERQIQESGLEWTFLRLEVASADALQWAFDVPGQLKAGDVVRGPYGAASGSPIHPADFAAVAVAALTEDRHAGKTYLLTGPQSLTHIEQVQLIGKALANHCATRSWTWQQREGDQPLRPC